MKPEQYGEPVPDLALALRRRARVFRVTRVAVLGLVVGYFLAPYAVRAWIPAWLPFLAALALELQFFVGGYLQSRRAHAGRDARADRGPQPRDLAELGGERWREAHAIEHAGERHFVASGGLSDEEVAERLDAYLRDPQGLHDDESSDGAATPAAELGVGAHLDGGERRRQLRYAAEALAVVALAAGILFYAARPHGWSAVSAANQARAETLFSREAARIAGHPARVRCDTSGTRVGFVQDADGVAEVGGVNAYLVPSICDTLYQLAFKHTVPSFSKAGRALAVLAHESWHLRGVADEGLANCYGFQSGVAVGVELGLSERTARAMMREQLATNALDSSGNPEYLVSGECRDRGADDLHPASPEFP